VELLSADSPEYDAVAAPADPRYLGGIDGVEVAWRHPRRSARKGEARLRT
jgi:hypothetical protein